MFIILIVIIQNKLYVLSLLKLPTFILHLSYFIILLSVHLHYGTEFLIIFTTTLKMNTLGYFIHLRVEFRRC